MRNDMVSDVVFNMMGKSPIFGPQLPNTATTVYTVDDIKQVVIDAANGLTNGITKDRIKVSLVVDNEHTTYVVAIAVYFDINDPNFQQTDNEFDNFIRARNVNNFLMHYALNYKGGKPYDPVIRSEDGIHIVLDVRKIFKYITDASGQGYERYSGTRGRKMDIKVDVVKRGDGNRVIIDNFVVTKTLAVEPKAEIGELTSKKLRDF